MTRVTTTLVVLLLLANGAATVMAASGLSDDLGVELNPGIEDTRDQMVSDFKNGFSPSTSVVESLLSMLVAFGRLFELLIEATYAMPVMLMNVGFPEYAVFAFFTPAYILATLELGSILVGRRTV